MTLSAATLGKLAQFDTPTICNIIELFEVRPRNRGYMDSRVRSNYPDFPPRSEEHTLNSSHRT